MTRALHISLAALAAAGVAGTAVVSASGSHGGATAARKKAPALKLRKTTLGTVVVDSRGRTLYAFGHDLKDRSRCAGACASNWPPAASPKKPTAGKGIAKAKLKVIKRSDGSRQLSYAGHPLYRFIGDSKPGDVNGENVNAFGGIWHAVANGGKVVTGPPSSGSSSTGSGGPAPAPYPAY